MIFAKLKRTKRSIFYIAAALLSLSGIYLLLLILSPNLPLGPSPQAIQEKVQTAKVYENRLLIPAIGVDIAIVEGDSEAALEKGVWHREPQNGNPEIGGNFVLSAHRFEIGWTPQQTHTKSPFYHIDKLKEGDKIYVDYGNKRYIYTITRKYQVDRYAVAIEGPSTEAKMTLYSCDLRGEQAGREVIEAKPTTS